MKLISTQYRWLVALAIIIPVTIVAGRQTGRWMRGASIEPVASNVPAKKPKLRAELVLMGNKPAQAGIVCAIPYRNTTEKPITLDRLQSSCKCTIDDNSTVTILPGETKSIPVTVDLSNQTNEEFAKPMRPFETTIKANVIDGPVPVVAWILRGQVVNPITVRPAPIFFGERSKLTNDTPPRLVEVTVHQPFDHIEFDVARMPIRIEAVEDRLSKTSKWRVIWLKEKPERFDGVLAIKAMSKDGIVVAVAEIPVDGGW
jgi:hypothetical protein